MCLMLYIGTRDPLPRSESPDLSIEDIDELRRNVARWFQSPEVGFVGAHTGCSCGFPSVIADPPLEYYEGMPLGSDDRGADLRSVRALIDLLRHTTRAGPVELYPIADGDESKPPRGAIEWQLGTLDPERLFFNEGFMHVVRDDRPR